MQRLPTYDELSTVVLPAIEREMTALGIDKITYPAAWHDSTRKAISSVLNPLLYAQSIDDYTNILLERKLPLNDEKIISLKKAIMQEKANPSVSNRNNYFSNCQNLIISHLTSTGVNAAMGYIDFQRIRTAVFNALGEQMTRFGFNEERNPATWNHYIRNRAAEILASYEVATETADIAAELSRELGVDTAPDVSYITPELSAPYAAAHDNYLKGIGNITDQVPNFAQIDSDIKAVLSRVGYRAVIDELKTIQSERAEGKSPT
jgi:hypothetical protein